METGLIIHSTSKETKVKKKQAPPDLQAKVDSYEIDTYAKAATAGYSRRDYTRARADLGARQLAACLTVASGHGECCGCRRGHE